MTRVRSWLYYIRWNVVNLLVLAALAVAPRDAVRGRLVDYLNAFSREVYDAIQERKR